MVKGPLRGNRAEMLWFALRPILRQSRCDCKGDGGPGSGLGDHSSRVMAVGTSGNDVGEIR